MTTAHRPTWQTAKGGEEQGGQRIFAPSRQTSAKDAASHTQLKFRQSGQQTTGDLKDRDLRLELIERERKYYREQNRGNFEEERQEDLKLLTGPDGTSLKPSKPLVPKAIDADDDDGASASDSDSSDDDEDDEAALMAELTRIKKERAEEAARKTAEDAKVRQSQLQAEVAGGNPLINQNIDFTVKRRWDEDVVFRNQTRGEPKQQKRFINDTIRNDFHRRFLNRYVR